MLLEAVALTFCAAVGGAAPVGQQPPLPSAERLAKLADERGPIRRHLEAAQASPIVQVASERLGLSVTEARAQVRSTSPPANTNVWRALALLGIVFAVGLAVFLSRVE